MICFEIIFDMIVKIRAMSDLLNDQSSHRAIDEVLSGGDGDMNGDDEDEDENDDGNDHLLPDQLDAGFCQVHSAVKAI